MVIITVVKMSSVDLVGRGADVDPRYLCTEEGTCLRSRLLLATEHCSAGPTGDGLRQQQQQFADCLNDQKHEQMTAVHLNTNCPEQTITRIP